MIRILNNSIALTLCVFTITSCIGQISKTGENKLDPIEFGKNFSSVCKVGKRGGDGTLIKDKWVLTAGHVAQGMFNRNNGNLSVYFENDISYKVKNVFLHPKFEPMGPYDVALLELESQVEEFIPVGIYKKTDEKDQLIYLAGHGDKRASDGSWIKDGKLRAYTNVIDEVNDKYIVFDYDAPENNPTEREGTSGPGDSGGPALLKSGNDYFVAGISSMGKPGTNGPATFGAIEYFVRVSKYQDWIRETINDPNMNLVYQNNDADNKVMRNENEAVTLSDGEKSKNALMILNSLENYSEKGMLATISQTYDPSVLQKRSAIQIMNNMPFLIKELQNAQLEKIIAETPQKQIFQLKKGNNKYILEIFFLGSSDKIEQMGFGKIN